MELDTIVDQANIYIGYDTANNWLYVDWKGEYTPASSQASCLLMLESLRARPCAKILNDNTNITSTTVTLTPWSMWWLGEMMHAGLAYIAWIYPRNFEARQLMETAMQRIERPVVATFDDVASAYVWLQQQTMPAPPFNHNAARTEE
jgi:hypothetical protein